MRNRACSLACPVVDKYNRTCLVLAFLLVFTAAVAAVYKPKGVILTHLDTLAQSRRANQVVSKFERRVALTIAICNVQSYVAMLHLPRHNFRTTVERKSLYIHSALARLHSESLTFPSHRVDIVGVFTRIIRLEEKDKNLVGYGLGLGLFFYFFFLGGSACISLSKAATTRRSSSLC